MAEYQRRVAVVRATMSFTGGNEPSLMSATGLNKKELREWDGWKDGARRYLATAGDSIDLERVVAEYTAAVHRFNEWFGKVWVGSHLAAFDELVRLDEVHDALLRQAR